MRFVVRYDNPTTKRYYYRTVWADFEHEAARLSKRFARKGFTRTSMRGHHDY